MSAAEKKGINFQYKALITLVSIGVLGVILWRVFLVPSPDPVDDPMVARTDRFYADEDKGKLFFEELFDNEVFQSMTSFQIAEISEWEEIGRSNPFSPFVEEEEEEEIDEEIDTVEREEIHDYDFYFDFNDEDEEEN